MKKTALKSITNYIEILRDVGYSIVLSCFSPVLKEVMPTLLEYESHLPMVCSYLKSVSNTRKICMKNKTKLIQSPPNEICYSCCWAGVEEYIVPLRSSGNIICCVHVSGYRGKLEKSGIKARRHKSCIGKIYEELYLTLSENVPDNTKIIKITEPLEYMFQMLYDECLASDCQHDDLLDIYMSAKRYINNHYMENLTVADIAKAQNYSSSYLRYVFTKHSGKGVMEHLTSARLTHAANLLKYTHMSVTSIAFDCGFGDSNYFSTAFKKRYGLTPTKYRNAR